MNVVARHKAQAESLLRGRTPPHNFNNITIENADGPAVIQQDNKTTTNAETTCYFKNIEHHLCEHINEAKVVFGCAAWLASVPVLLALMRPSVSILIQKEDYLRPDFETQPEYIRKTKKLYKNLHTDLERYSLPYPGNSLSTHGCSEMEPIRVVGNNNNSCGTNSRMHNKFFVFCTTTENHTPENLGSPAEIHPYAVWTGSFNPSRIATHSFENAVYIKNKEMAEAYLKEFAQIYAFSEPLDWEHEYMTPEYRIGS